MGDRGELLEQCCLEMFNTYKRAADEAGFMTQAPAVQAALLGLCRTMVTCLAAREMVGDVLREVRIITRNRGSY